MTTKILFSKPRILADFNKQKMLDYFRGIVWPGVIKHWRILSLVIGFVLLFNLFFTLGINASESLPDHVYLVLKYDKDLHRGDYATFRWNGGGPYGAGLTFLKRVKGVSGDTVTTSGRDFFVNGAFVGTAKTHARTGQPLTMGSTGVIPAHAYYMAAPHRDSLDSRYAMTGWITQDRIQGRAIPLF
jgi:conjugal transfer pilin signal peptidase TrbI